jgi:opacity protein-like surface antigen
VQAWRCSLPCPHRTDHLQPPLELRAGALPPRNLLPRHRLQPTSSLLVGYLLSSNKIPVDTAGSFNFTFEAGAGLEYFLSQNRSMRLEYQIQHFSNAYTAQTNPGVDSGLFKFTYAFGR